MAAPAGWYPDPQQPVPGTPPQQRYWDGAAWTAHVAPLSPDPSYGQPSYGQPTYGQPSYGQPAYGHHGHYRQQHHGHYRNRKQKSFLKDFFD